MIIMRRKRRVTKNNDQSSHTVPHGPEGKHNARSSKISVILRSRDEVRVNKFTYAVC